MQKAFLSLSPLLFDSYDSDLRESAIVAGLTPATTFLIRMQAINEIERSAYTEAIVLKTQEEAPTEAPSNVQVQTGGESELIVTWQVSVVSIDALMEERSIWNRGYWSKKITC